MTGGRSFAKSSQRKNFSQRTFLPWLSKQGQWFADSADDRSIIALPKKGGSLNSCLMTSDTILPAFSRVASAKVFVEDQAINLLLKDWSCSEMQLRTCQLDALPSRRRSTTKPKDPSCQINLRIRFTGFFRINGTIIPSEERASGLWGEWGMREGKQKICPCLILTSRNPRNCCKQSWATKKTRTYFLLYWMVNRDPYTVMVYYNALYNWVV